MNKFKVAVIGGGPGGYSAAIRLKQYGIHSIVFEKERLGGVCLNWGCIPTKALVKLADLYQEIKERENSGIFLSNTQIDYHKAFDFKSEVVDKLVSGIEFLFKKRNIPVVYSQVNKIKKTETGFLISTSNDQYLAEYLILATGSEPKTLPAISFDGVNILSSRDILSMKNLPESLAVIGGGVIGCEFASIFQQLGVKIQIIEFLPDLIAQEDSEISKRLLMMMKKKKIKVHTSSKVEYIDQQDDKLILNLSNGKSLESEKVLLCVGRKPVCDIVFEGVELLQENGSVTIDNMMRTNIQKVFAIGDLTGKLMLAHTAGRQALLVAEVIKADIEGDEKEFEVINYDNIPRCTFTNPAIGSVGLTEDQAKKLYGDIKVGKFMFSANGKALAGGVSEGFVKVVIEQKSGRLRGMHIIGPEAAELIAQGSAMINLSADIKSLQKVVYAHPTLSECVGEAIEDCQNLAVHKI